MHSDPSVPVELMKPVQMLPEIDNVAYVHLVEQLSVNNV